MRPFGLLLVALAIVAGPASAQEPLARLAEVGPWPEVSRLVGYQGRLWFANSVKGRNHNSADLYSYDPADRSLRYERHLFSQDAGRPLVYGGRLYWPYEDPRSSLGWGEVLVTDGRDWRALVLPTAEIYHVHALAAPGGRLLAATSAWRAGLQVSADGGASWQMLYDHPTPARRVSRITELIALDERLLAYLIERDRRSILSFDADGAVTPLEAWPERASLRGWARLGDWIYLLSETPDGAAVWRSDGRQLARLTGPRANWRPRDLASDGRSLWAVGLDGDGGLLWRSEDGGDWRSVAQMDGRPQELLAHDGWIYVGGSRKGTGALWGAPLAADDGPADGASEIALAPEMPAAGSADLLARLEAALDDPRSYADHGAGLRGLIYQLALTRPAEAVWQDLLARPGPDLTLGLIGGKTQVTAQDLARWGLLWGMSLSGSGRVPTVWLGLPWPGESNRAEKYFATAPMAIWAAGGLGQSDRATLAALVERLGAEGDPRWLTGDVVGALTALTDRRFGYDLAAWRAWWAAEGEAASE